MNNTITIVTPSLNQGQFIEQTIKSVLSQEGDFYIDYIISDGGSTDNSVKIIKKYDELLKIKKYPIKCRGITYRWRSEKDNGQSHAINKGFKIAKGDILAWINSDDYYEPNVFEFIIKKFRENSDIDLIYGDGRVIDSKNKILENICSKDGDFKKFKNRGYSIFQPSAFFTKKIIIKINFLDKNLHYAMDYDLWLKILKIGKVIHFSKILANFRKWENSKTNLNQQKFLIERQVIFNKYGGNKFDPKKYYNILYNFYFFKFIKNKFPFIYNKFKKIFYFIIDRINAKNEIS